MDSVTQAVLGATVTYAVVGHKVGRRAALYGAALGTLPDLDVFVDFGGAVENMTYHRGVTHSFFVQLLATPVLVLGMRKLPGLAKASFWRWFLAIYLCFVTHSLADMFTVYGTQVLWPLTDFPFAHSVLFIVDPVFTVPMIVAFLGVLILKSPPARSRLNTTALTISGFYLFWCFTAKSLIDTRVEAALAAQGIEPEVYESTPAPLTTLIWRGVAIQGDTYYEIYTSIFDLPDEVSITAYPRNAESIAEFRDVWQVERLRWFTKGQYSVNRFGDSLYISDLRMGAHGGYVFNFEAARLENDRWTQGSFSELASQPNFDLGAVFSRILDPAVQLSP